MSSSSKSFSVRPAAMGAAAAIGGLSASAFLVAMTMGIASDMRASAVRQVEAAIAAQALVDTSDITVPDVAVNDGAGDTKSSEAVQRDDAEVSVRDGKKQEVTGASETPATALQAEDNVSASEASAPASDGYERRDGMVVYHIEPGDTLCKISTKFGVSVDAIASANGIWDVDLIYANSSLVIPGI